MQKVSLCIVPHKKLQWALEYPERSHRVLKINKKYDENDNFFSTVCQKKSLHREKKNLNNQLFDFFQTQSSIFIPSKNVCTLDRILRRLMKIF